MNAYRIATAALLALAAAQPARADFVSLVDLARGEFRDLARDLGAAFSYKGVTPATPLGTLNLAIEAEKMGDNVSLSAKVGWRL